MCKQSLYLSSSSSGGGGGDTHLFLFVFSLFSLRFYFFFSVLSKNETVIQDISISLATLEDVFLNLSRNELEKEAALDVDVTNNEITSSPTTSSTRRERITAIGDVSSSKSFCSQFHALTNKTITYQKRQTCQSSCLVCFPIFCIAMLLLVQM